MKIILSILSFINLIFSSGWSVKLYMQYTYNLKHYGLPRYAENWELCAICTMFFTGLALLILLTVIKTNVKNYYAADRKKRYRVIKKGF